MTVRRMIKDAFESYLMENGIDYFIGGSERFGWTDRESDIDFFVSCCDGQLINMFQQFPSKTIMKNYIASTYDDNIDTQFSILGGLIHLNVFLNSFPSYKVLKAEHEKVEKTLNKNDDLNRVVTSLKRFTSIRGRDIYDCLKKL